MRSITSLFIFAACFCFAACTPNPLDIEPEPAIPQVAIASTVINPNTLLVTVTYSINSLLNLNEGGGGGRDSIGTNTILVDGALVVLSSGSRVDTLLQLYPGVYGSVFLNLKPSQQYSLKVYEPKYKTSAVATSTYLPAVTVTELRPEVIRTPTDTTVHLHVRVQDDPTSKDYFLLSYSKIDPAKAPSPLGSAGFSVMSAGQEKKLELFTDAEAVAGQITKDFVLAARDNDTLYVQVGRVEKGYYEFLTAYRKTGSGLNQLIGEPITLPTNIRPGLGYFSLYDATRAVFILKRW